MSCCNKFLRIDLKNINIMASGQRRLGTNSLVRSYNNIVEPVYLYIYIYIYYVMSRLIPSESEPVYLICELNGNYNY